MEKGKSTRRSAVWKYFSTEDTRANHVKCMLCGVELSFAGGSTGTMSNHLKYKHKSVSLGGSSSTPGTSGRSSSAASSQPRQGLITAFKTQVMSKAKWQQITQSLANMCARDLRPLSIVEGDGFKSFCNELNPAYKLPGKTTIAKYVTISYDEMKAELMSTLKDQIGIAITCDHWTSCAVEGYLTVTGHFVDDNFRYHNRVLATRQTTERHTGLNIANDLASIFTEFGIEKKRITALVSDNASNMVSCMQQEPVEGILHVRCFAHTLQLSVRNALDSIASVSHIIAAGRKIVSYFRRSVVASEGLKTRQKQMNLPQHALVLDCATRWNSTLDMFERLLEQRLAIYAVVHNMKSASDARLLDLTDSQWRVMEEMVPVLKPLYMATRIMCSEEYPTISGLYPILFSLKNHHFLRNEAESVTVANFKTKLLDDIERRHNLSSDDILSTLAMQATLLDPRYKNLPFLDDDKRAVVHENTITCMEILTSNVNNATATCTEGNQGIQSTAATGMSESDDLEPPASKCAKLTQDDVSYLLGSYYTEDCEIVTPKSPDEEFKLYRSVKPIGGNGNPFDWWEKNKSSYPTLSVLARRVLSIPATSVPSERVFSVAGGTVTKLRGALHGDSVDMLIFLNKGLRERVSIAKSAEEIIPIKEEPTDANDDTAVGNVPTLPDLPQL